MAAKVKAAEKAGTDLLTQKVVAGIVAEPDMGRAALAEKLGVPPAIVWAVRGAMNVLDISPEARTYCQQRCRRAGVKVPVRRRSAAR